MLREQKFGVEVEMTGITRSKAASILGEIFGHTPSAYGGSHTVLDTKDRRWKVVYDSSIRPCRSNGDLTYNDNYKVELVTPPLNYEDIKLLQQIIRKLRDNGAKVNSSCGIHIHIDGANHSPASLKRLVNFMIERQDLLYEALETGQRERRWCRKGLRKRIIKRLGTSL